MDLLAVKAEPSSGHRVDTNAILSPGNAIEELKAQDPPRSNTKRDFNKATSLGSSGNAKYQAFENTSTEDSNHEVSHQPSFNTSSTCPTLPPKHEFPDHVDVAGSQKVPVRNESVVSKSQRKARNVANTSEICCIGIESERKTGNLGLLTRSVVALLFSFLLILAAFGIVSGITQRPRSPTTNTPLSATICNRFFCFDYTLSFSFGLDSLHQTSSPSLNAPNTTLDWCTRGGLTQHWGTPPNETGHQLVCKMTCSSSFPENIKEGHLAMLGSCMMDCFWDRFDIKDLDCKGVLWFMDRGRNGTCVFDHDMERPVSGKEERVAGVRLINGIE